MKVLVANRGEIAVRICGTLSQMGIGTVAVYSEADRHAPHVMAADEAFALGGLTPAESYLRIDRLLEAARHHGADAVHPGYGFLSENARFAAACRDAGLLFIGPSPEVIEAMGDKVRAKALMAGAGVPVVPSVDGELVHWGAAAERLGYPLLVKAAAGGGGKGMRRVDSPDQLENALETAAREAGHAFGDNRIFLEKYIERPRHVEFQIFGDSQGNVMHLYERECSIQRRHQKVVEETPSPVLTPALRERMAQAAVAAGKAIRYTNAGTVEFIVAPDGSFYFLEVNTRLQVEHPVTEWLLRTDLVAAQVLVAQGHPLPFDTPEPRGHAMECRIYAEIPEQSFMPSTGIIQVCRPPVAPWVRVDTGVTDGSEVSVHYDPMLAKLSVWGRDRAEAIARMRWALEHYVILGVGHNIEFLRRLMDDPDFQAGRIHTHFLAERPGLLQAPDEVPEAALAVAAMALSVPAARAAAGAPGGAASSGPWDAGGHWRGL